LSAIHVFIGAGLIKCGRAADTSELQTIRFNPTDEMTMSDLEILCEHKPSPAKLEVMGVDDWPIWKKEPSTFPWRYDQTEICYILRGRFRVTPEGGETQEFGRGDLITFPSGLSCTWEIIEAVEKHYHFA